MTAFDTFLGRVVDVLFSPLRALPPLLGLALVSLVVAVGMLWVYRKTSNQQALALAKGRMTAGLFEIRLFSDDPRAIFRAQGDILRNNLQYLRWSFVPFLWTVVPLVLLIAQLQSFYGWRPVPVGESFLLTMKLDAASPQAATRPPVDLRLPAGLQAEAGDAWIPALSEVAWRIRAEREGRYAVEVEMGDRTLGKDVHVGGGLTRLSPIRPRAGFFDQLLYPVERPLVRSGPIEQMHVSYPTQSILILGWDVPWLVAFLVLVMGFALLLKGRFRVTF